jgi:hypothetical protein
MKSTGAFCWERLLHSAFAMFRPKNLGGQTPSFIGSRTYWGPWEEALPYRMVKPGYLCKLQATVNLLLWKLFCGRKDICRMDKLIKSHASQTLFFRVKFLSNGFQVKRQKSKWIGLLPSEALSLWSSFHKTSKTLKSWELSLLWCSSSSGRISNKCTLQGMAPQILCQDTLRKEHWRPSIQRQAHHQGQMAGDLNTGKKRFSQPRAASNLTLDNYVIP